MPLKNSINQGFYSILSQSKKDTLKLRHDMSLYTHTHLLPKVTIFQKSILNMLILLSYLILFH